VIEHFELGFRMRKRSDVSRQVEAARLRGTAQYGGTDRGVTSTKEAAEVETSRGADVSDETRTSDDPERIWSLGMQLDNKVIQRGGFFLIGHSMLVVAYAALLTAGSSGSRNSALSSVARVLAVFAFIHTLGWIYVSHYNWAYLKYVRKRAQGEFPVYDEIRKCRPKGPVDDGTLSAYLMPVMTAVMWIVLMFLA
jgi:hypothetical protein